MQYFVAHWYNYKTKVLYLEHHVLRKRDNSMKAGIEEDPGWSVPAASVSQYTKMCGRSAR